MIENLQAPIAAAFAIWGGACFLAGLVRGRYVGRRDGIEVERGQRRDRRVALHPDYESRLCARRVAQRAQSRQANAG
jgi:hypothetical protein